MACHREKMTHHARQRAQSRAIRDEAIAAVLAWGREVYIRGACIYVIGRHEIRQALREGIDLSDLDGVHVICANGGSILTVYRNRDLRGLRRAARFGPHSPRSPRCSA